MKIRNTKLIGILNIEIPNFFIENFLIVILRGHFSYKIHKISYLYYYMNKEYIFNNRFRETYYIINIFSHIFIQHITNKKHRKNVK